MPDNPERPRLTWRERETRRPRAVVLDPDSVATDSKPAPTIYEPDVLLQIPAATAERAVNAPTLEAVAATLGWMVTEEPLEPEPRRGGTRTPRGLDPAEEPRISGAAVTRRMRISVAPGVAVDKASLRPDAWRLLVEARRASVPGLGLNHVMSIDSVTTNPFKMNPFKMNPFKMNPFKMNPSGMDGYAYPGMGGRQPVSFIGADPVPSTLAEADRPVVAIFDTGCGSHPWLDAVVIDPVEEYQTTLGLVDGASDPEAFPSLGDPLDGTVDTAAGHGTFIAGIVLQACPDVRILPIRVSDGDGVILESDLIAALGRLVELIEHKKARIDVINLSLSYYHETPETQTVDSELYTLLARARKQGTVIVCSAGNDATDRPAAPASLRFWKNADGSTSPDCGLTKAEEAGLAPQVVVGALNPSRRSVALFSNVGDWVDTYVLGVSVLSTVPIIFEGGIQAELRRDEYGHRRETLDLDDFQAGFAVWSGTSFAAPLVAGRIAAERVPTASAKVAAARPIATIVDDVITACDEEDRSLNE